VESLLKEESLYGNDLADLMGKEIPVYNIESIKCKKLYIL
jgi:hypothetical protein